VTGVYDHGFIICAAMAGAAVVLMGLVRKSTIRQSDPA
jgi:hypothetical protein